MLRSLPTLLLLGLTTLLCACATTVARNEEVRTEANRTEQPQSQEWHTSMPTITAARQVRDRLREFGFSVRDNSGPVASLDEVFNYFNARVSADAGDGHHVRVDLRWIKDNDIQISVRSNLENKVTPHHTPIPNFFLDYRHIRVRIT